MANVDVKCPFCKQIDPVKKHGLGSTGHCTSASMLLCAWDPHLKRIIAHASSRRSKKTLHQLLRLLSGFNVAFWCADNFSAYDVLPNEKHITGKLYTQRIERENLNLRNRLKRLNRKTQRYSTSAEMHDRIIDTFTEREHYVL